ARPGGPHHLPDRGRWRDRRDRPHCRCAAIGDLGSAGRGGEQDRASGNIAAEFVARSDPDGYTIYIATFPYATSRYLYPSLSYDPIADFAPVTLIGLYPLMMVVPNSSPAHSVREFIAYAKVNKLSYASSGHGTSLHLAGELFKRKAGIEMTHVPYRGA